MKKVEYLLLIKYFNLGLEHVLGKNQESLSNDKFSNRIY